MKTIFTMNQYLYKAVAALMLLTVSLVSVQAAESDRALKQGDTIVVSYTRTTILGRYTYYVKGNANGTVTSTQTLDENCLWVLKTMTGTPSAVGRENNAKVTAQHLVSARNGNKSAFYMKAEKNGAVSLTTDNYTTIYTVKNAQGFGEFIEGNILCKSGNKNYYLNWNNGWAASNTSSPQTLRIQKWSLVEHHETEPIFSPNSALFEFAETDAEAARQAINVTCKVKVVTGKYYYNVSNPSQRIVIEQPTEKDPTSVSFSWQNTILDHKMTFTTPEKLSDGLYHFTLTPNGASPFSEMQESVQDIIDNIVCTATYGGKQADAYMNCIRRMYWHHVIDPLTFTITHPNYRFSTEGGELSPALEPFLIYQTGEEWVNTSGIVEKEDKSPAQRITYETPGLSVSTTTNVNWMSFTRYESLGIVMSATANTDDNPRSGQALIRVDYAPTAGGEATHFIRQVTLTQPGALDGAKIKFTMVPGHGDSQKDKAGRQRVHTDKKILYYKPGNGTNYGDEVELRPKELTFYSYRRWYNYDYNCGPQFCPMGHEADNTAWGNAPSVTANRTTYNYSPINTDNTTSRGVFAILANNKSPQGYKLLYEGVTEGIPTIKGWKTTTGGPKNDGVHTIACDLSAYNDGVYHEKNGQLDSIVEPTLSYRQLFELHPATEIADKIDALTDGKYLEEYEYTAPVGVDIYLCTAQRFRSKRYHNSEMCYYFWSNASHTLANLKQLGVDYTSVKWYRKIGTGAEQEITSPVYSASTDNMRVSHNTAEKVTYMLRVPTGGTGGPTKVINLAKFTVDYRAKKEVGPSATTIISNDRIKTDFLQLAEINFDYDKPGNRDNVISPKHLDWEDASFGFAYQKPERLASSRSTNTDLCYYGEYLLVNRWNPSSGGYGWMDKSIENHTGKANGYMLFADGTLEPSMVASIQTDAQICSGQQMFCSAWVANACPSGYSSGSNPIFRFNVQGRSIVRPIVGTDTTYTDWEDVSVFFAGELQKGSKWQQINFPVHANSQSYDETRVCVYNFATTNTGNDFFIDDIYLYATPLPLSAYQASAACSGSDIVVAVKLDYENMDDQMRGQKVYYQGWAEHEGTMIAIPNLRDYKGYYMDGNDIQTGETQTVGNIIVPAKNFTPTAEQIYPTVQSFIDHLNSLDPETPEGRAGICYVMQPSGKYAMFIVHLLEQRTGGKYEVRMATIEGDLEHPLCAMRVELPIYRETKLTYGKNNQDLVSPVADACPNSEDQINVLISMPKEGGAQGETVHALGRADWLIGQSFDSIYAPIDTLIRRYGLTKEQILEKRVLADTAFAHYYKYTRDEVTTAIVYDLRREPVENDPNYNYDVSDYTLLDSTAFRNPKNYYIIYSLCQRGLMDLNISSRYISLTPGDSIFLWVYPIVGSAELEDGTKLAVCNQPQWVDFRAKKLDARQQTINFSKVANKDKTPAQKLQIPSTRVIASQANTCFVVPVQDVFNAVLAWDSLRVIGTNDPAVSALLDGEKTFHMRYYSDMVWQGPNDATAKGWNAAEHNWEYYGKNGYNTITFRPIDQNHLNYLADRHDFPSQYSSTDANWATKENPQNENTGLNSQPGFRKLNSTGATMHANYTYQMMTYLVTDNFEGEIRKGDKKLEGCDYGSGFFDVIVVPELLIWRPQMNNDWGDDNNWHAIINGVEQEWGFAPLAGTSVIIPVLENPLMYPAVTGINLYPMSYGYTPTACHNIYMEAGAHILGQEKLSYNKAYIDMPMLTNDWNLISAPLQGMYSGDFYVPHTGDYTSYTDQENVVYTLDDNGFVNSVRSGDNDQLFETNTIVGIRSADAAYVTYTEFYNSNVQIYHHNLSDGTHTTSQGFSPSNGLDNPIAPGQGINALSFGPNNKGEHTPYALRLPKTETQYTYYKDGSATEYLTPAGNINRTNANRFAFTTTSGTGDDAQMTITLTNSEASSFFMLGNPTMAYVDMGEFFEDNNTVLSGTFYYLHGGAWSAKTTSMEDFFLSPMEAILVETKNQAKLTSLSVVLKAGHLTLNNHSYVQGNAPARAPEPASAPRRAAAASDAPVELLTITAFTDDAQGMAYLGKKDGTSLNYIPGEDACFISSGVETEDDVITPMNIYTVRDSSTMMVDVRPALSRIPLGFVIATNERASNDSINLCFNTNLQWDSELYLVDTNTGESTRVQDGLIVRVETPANHEQRYVLMGTDMEPVINPGISTGIENTEVLDPEEPTMQQPEKFFHNGLFYIRHTNGLYTITGVRVK